MPATFSLNEIIQFEAKVYVQFYVLQICNTKSKNQISMYISQITYVMYRTEKNNKFFFNFIEITIHIVDHLNKQ